ncbi:unnamed protein product [Chilo suppressalis]|uniref:Secreted protein n=1 Tax=Chilo suppressalis TaxID=168631 RepID=A0ABN8B4R2_CHISP|nr:unnamed protein product [Chilo suppressalis]
MKCSFLRMSCSVLSTVSTAFLLAIVHSSHTIREQSLSTCPLSLLRDTPQTGVSALSKSMGILNMACAVLPPGSSVATIDNDATAMGILPCLLTSTSMPVVTNVFPVPPGASKKFFLSWFALL